jgi:hypothetical protein
MRMGIQLRVGARTEVRTEKVMRVEVRMSRFQVFIRIR